MNPEVEYLTYVHNSTDIERLIEIQQNYHGVIPPKYKLFVCDNCATDLAVNLCSVCIKGICDDCASFCQSTGRLLCPEHFIPCKFCDEKCCCVYCGRFNADYICSDCADEKGMPFSCGCIIGRKDYCFSCQSYMHPINKQRLSKKN